MKLVKVGRGRGCTYKSIESLVFPNHLHSEKTNGRLRNKAIVANVLSLIEDGGVLFYALSNQYRRWQEFADDEMNDKFNAIVREIANISYSCKHPELSGQQIKERIKSRLSRQAINSSGIKAFRENDVCVDVKSIIES